MKAIAGIRLSEFSHARAGSETLTTGTPTSRTLFGPVEANAFLKTMFSPWVQDLGLLVEACSPVGAVLRLPRRAHLLRPGDTLSGPALMACADTAMAVAIMGDFGELRNVATVSLTIDFMRPVPAGDITLGARVRRRGGSLIFTECTFFEPRNRDVAVHATATWAVIHAAAVRRQHSDI
jgi:uncharacterized protein (TIGR00369 family)